MSKVNMDRFVKTFCELVKISSESYNEKEFVGYLEGYFGKMDGVKTKKDSYGNLIVKIPAKNSSSKTVVGFSCHADTVKPGVGINPVVDREEGIIKSDGKTILGADDKAGIAAVIETVLCAEKHPPLEFIISICEEPGLFGSTNMDYSLVDAKIAYLLDGEEVDKIIVGGPSTVNLTASYKGIPAHAGMAPEKGISSILAASKAISKLRLGYLDEETTANIGVIQGGEVRNGVPEHTKVQAECRSLNHEKVIKLADEMEAIFKQGAKEVGAEVTVEKTLIYKAYLLSESSDIVKGLKKAFKKNGVETETLVIRGGTDAANHNAHGISTAVLGMGAREIHSCKEYLILKEAEVLTKTLVDIVEELA